MWRSLFSTVPEDVCSPRCPSRTKQRFCKYPNRDLCDITGNSSLKCVIRRAAAEQQPRPTVIEHASHVQRFPARMAAPHSTTSSDASSPDPPQPTPHRLLALPKTSRSRAPWWIHYKDVVRWQLASTSHISRARILYEILLHKSLRPLLSCRHLNLISNPPPLRRKTRQ